MKIAKSPVTNTIYAGRLNKNGTMWIGKKTDVTSDVIDSVFDLVRVKRIFFKTTKGFKELKIVDINKKDIPEEDVNNFEQEEET